jgi:lipoprotein signal peptidase
MIDRVARGGEVIDLVNIRLWSGYTWPDFNVADAAIVLGVLGLTLQLLANEGESRARVAGARKPPDDPIKPEDSAA